MKTQHKSKRLALSQGEAGIYHVLELFISKTEIKNCLERWLFLSTNGNGVLVIFHTKQVESDSGYLKIGIYMLFYKVWHSSPPLLSQTMAN
jgi:hypothetical protein